MLRWQRETQQACESLGWLVVETRGDGRIYVWSPDAEPPLVEYERLPASVQGLHLVGDRIYAARFDGRVYVLP